ncbi:hypothetical protein F5880DRAFT_863857 [Lentinula raphanica]|nr:hypothetical protein F5880DRAFT_863857 [Lentinula raphanica]
MNLITRAVDEFSSVWFPNLPLESSPDGWMLPDGIVENEMNPLSFQGLSIILPGDESRWLCAGKLYSNNHCIDCPGGIFAVFSNPSFQRIPKDLRRIASYQPVVSKCCSMHCLYQPISSYIPKDLHCTIFDTINSGRLTSSGALKGTGRALNSWLNQSIVQQTDECIQVHTPKSAELQLLQVIVRRYMNCLQISMFPTWHSRPSRAVA